MLSSSSARCELVPGSASICMGAGATHALRLEASLTTYRWKWMLAGEWCMRQAARGQCRVPRLARHGKQGGRVPSRCTLSCGKRMQAGHRGMQDVRTPLTTKEHANSNIRAHQGGRHDDAAATAHSGDGHPGAAHRAAAAAQVAARHRGHIPAMNSSSRVSRTDPGQAPGRVLAAPPLPRRRRRRVEGLARPPCAPASRLLMHMLSAQHPGAGTLHRGARKLRRARGGSEAWPRHPCGRRQGARSLLHQLHGALILLPGAAVPQALAGL